MDVTRRIVYLLARRYMCINNNILIRYGGLIMQRFFFLFNVFNGAFATSYPFVQLDIRHIQHALPSDRPMSSSNG